VNNLFRHFSIDLVLLLRGLEGASKYTGNGFYHFELTLKDLLGNY